MYQRILVAIDGSEPSNKALDEAIRLAKLTGGSIRLIHVVDELVYSSGFAGELIIPDALISRLKAHGERVLGDAKKRALAAGASVDAALIECLGARTADIVVEQAQAWKADLVVLGTHGRRGVNRFLLGSDAEQILRQAPVPVLLVRTGEA